MLRVANVSALETYQVGNKALQSTLTPPYVSQACLLLFSKGQILRPAEHLLFNLAQDSDACQLSGFRSELNSIFESSLTQELSIFHAAILFITISIDMLMQADLEIKAIFNFLYFFIKTFLLLENGLVSEVIFSEGNDIFKSTSASGK